MDSRDRHIIRIRTNEQNEADPAQIPEILASGGSIRVSAAEQRENAVFLGRFTNRDGTHIHVYSSDRICIGHVTFPIAAKKDMDFPYSMDVFCAAPGKPKTDDGTDWWHSAHLTCRKEDGSAFIPMDIRRQYGMEFIAEKLAAYEEAEESGKLIHVPCTADAWTLRPTDSGFVPCPYSFSSLAEPVELMESGLFGKTIFVTREDAEKSVQEK